MKLKIYNDGKGKSQSFEAFTDVFDCRGYGETEEEAIAEYKRLLSEHVNKLVTIDFDDKVYVDFLGYEIDE